MSMEFLATTYGVMKAITPSDAAGVRYRAFLVKVAGDIIFLDGQGNSVTLTLGAGDVNKIFPIEVTQVLATGTTATGIFGLN